MNIHPALGNLLFGKGLLFYFGGRLLKKGLAYY